MITPLLSALLMLREQPLLCVASQTEVRIMRASNEQVAVIAQRPLRARCEVVSATSTGRAYYLLISKAESAQRRTCYVARFDKLAKTWSEIRLPGDSEDFRQLTSIGDQFFATGRKLICLEKGRKLDKPIVLSADATYTRIDQSTPNEAWVTSATAFKEAMVFIKVTHIRCAAGKLAKEDFALDDMPQWAGSYEGAPAYVSGHDFFIRKGKKWMSTPLDFGKAKAVSEVYLSDSGAAVLVARDSVFWKSSIKDHNARVVFSHEGRPVRCQVFGKECFITHDLGRQIMVYRLDLVSGDFANTKLECGSRPAAFVAVLER